MHSANTLMANIVPYAERLRLGRDDVVLMASPMAHQTGFMYGLMMPIMLQAQRRAAGHLGPGQGGRTDPERRRHLHHGVDALPDRPHARRVGERRRRAEPARPSSAPARRSRARWSSRRAQALGAKIVSAWGMTENGAVTLIKLDDDDALAFTTDGCALPGVEVKVVDADGAALPPGEVGKLVVRSCSNFGGYLKRPQWNATDADGWFDTGDLARMDANGLHPHRRPHQGRHHPGRREHSGRRNRGAALQASGRGAGRHRGLSGRAPGRARLRRRRAEAGPDSRASPR